MKKLFAVIWAALILVSPLGSAQASSILWTLDNVTFSGGSGTIEGSFIYDSGLNSYRDINVTVIGSESLSGNGTPFDGLYSFAHRAAPFGIDFNKFGGDLTGLPAISADFSPFGDSGFQFMDVPGRVEIISARSSLRNCTTADCSISNGNLNLSGEMLGIAVPLPPAIWLFMTAFAGLVVLTRKASSKII